MPKLGQAGGMSLDKLQTFTMAVDVSAADVDKPQIIVTRLEVDEQDALMSRLMGGLDDSAPQVSKKNTEKVERGESQADMQARIMGMAHLEHNYDNAPPPKVTKMVSIKETKDELQSKVERQFTQQAAVTEREPVIKKPSILKPQILPGQANVRKEFTTSKLKPIASLGDDDSNPFDDDTTASKKKKRLPTSRPGAIGMAARPSISDDDGSIDLDFLDQEEQLCVKNLMKMNEIGQLEFWMLIACVRKSEGEEEEARELLQNLKQLMKSMEKIMPFSVKSELQQLESNKIWATKFRNRKDQALIILNMQHHDPKQCAENNFLRVALLVILNMLQKTDPEDKNQSQVGSFESGELTMEAGICVILDYTNVNAKSHGKDKLWKQWTDRMIYEFDTRLPVYLGDLYLWNYKKEACCVAPTCIVPERYKKKAIVLGGKGGENPIDHFDEKQLLKAYGGQMEFEPEAWIKSLRGFEGGFNMNKFME